MSKKRKAFTLTELLVVVVIIGVLSAVVLPKFSKVIETRKTTEAEAMMAAVRNEQEARCSISKNYTQIGQLGVYKGSTASKDKSPNFTYANNADGVGMIASAKSGKYQLEMPSYADGRVCCSDVENGGCEALSKSYPSCAELKAKADYVQGNADCGAYVSPCSGSDCNVDECPASHEEIADYTDSDGCTVKTVWELKAYPTCWVSSTSKMNCPAPTECIPDTIEMQTCNQCGKKTRTCQANGTWGEYGACSVSSKIECDNTEEDCDPALKPATTQTCGCGGTQTRIVTCLQPSFVSLSATEGETLPADFLSRKIWSAGPWGACQNETSTDCDNTARKCGGRLPSEWACTPGTVQKGPVDGKHNTCKRWISGQQQQFMEEIDISLDDEGGVDNTLPDVGDEGVHNNRDTHTSGGHYEEYEGNFECVDICDRWLGNNSCTENCRWIAASCGSAGGHGGGGGSGPDGVEHYMENMEDDNRAGDGISCSYNITVNEGYGGGGLWCANCSDGSITCGRVNY